MKRIIVLLMMVVMLIVPSQIFGVELEEFSSSISSNPNVLMADDIGRAGTTVLEKVTVVSALTYVSSSLLSMGMVSVAEGQLMRGEAAGVTTGVAITSAAVACCSFLAVLVTGAISILSDSAGR